MVVECADTGWCGEIMGWEKTAEGWAVVLEDRKGRRRPFPAGVAAFLVEGRPTTLLRPVAAAQPALPLKSASGSIAVRNHQARVARASRIWVEGIHDAELVEKIWGHDLRVEGVVVEQLEGIDNMPDRLEEFGPGPERKVVALVDHLVPGSKETRIAGQIEKRFGPHVRVLGHPYVDVWQAVRPSALGIAAWPVVPRGESWKSGVISRLGWREDESSAWKRILSRVNTYSDLEPSLLARVEEAIDIVTA